MINITFEEMDYLEVDYDSSTFSILKEGKVYTYDIQSEIDLLDRILDSGNVEFEVYGQERQI